MPFYRGNGVAWVLEGNTNMQDIVFEVADLSVNVTPITTLEKQTITAQVTDILTDGVVDTGKFNRIFLKGAITIENEISIACAAYSDGSGIYANRVIFYFLFSSAGLGEFKLSVDISDYNNTTLEYITNIPTIPDIIVNNGNAESGKYISQVAVDETNKHKLNVTKADLPTGGGGGTSNEIIVTDGGGGTFNMKIWVGTPAQHAALEAIDNNTLYIIKQLYNATMIGTGSYGPTNSYIDYSLDDGATWQRMVTMYDLDSTPDWSVTSLANITQIKLKVYYAKVFINGEPIVPATSWSEIITENYVLTEDITISCELTCYD